MTPDGVDVDFENVGGAIMESAFGRLNVRAHVALCGLISGNNDDAPSLSAGPRNFCNLLIQRVHLEGFIVLDHFGRAPEIVPRLAGWMAEGRTRGLLLPAHDLTAHTSMPARRRRASSRRPRHQTPGPRESSR